MAYKTRTINEEETKRPRKKSKSGMIFFFALLLIVSPVIYGPGLIFYGNWQSMVGTHISVRTPVLDTIADAYRECRFQSERRFRPMMHTGHWTPGTAVPLALVIAGLGAVLLRKGH